MELSSFFCIQYITVQLFIFTFLSCPFISIELFIYFLFFYNSTTPSILYVHLLTDYIPLTSFPIQSNPLETFQEKSQPSHTKYTLFPY